MTLWRKADQFDPAKSSLATWLYRIARNRRIDLLRRDRVEFFDPMENAFDIGEDPQTDRQIDRQNREEISARAGGPAGGATRAGAPRLLRRSVPQRDRERAGLPLGTVSRASASPSRGLRRRLETDGVVEVE